MCHVSCYVKTRILWSSHDCSSLCFYVMLYVSSPLLESDFQQLVSQVAALALEWKNGSPQTGTLSL